jgi:hypothetical protein
VIGYDVAGHRDSTGGYEMTLLYVAYHAGVRGGHATGYAIIQNTSVPQTKDDVDWIIRTIEDEDSALSNVIPLTFYPLQRDAGPLADPPEKLRESADSAIK